MANLLNLQEQALLRGWIERLGWPILGELYLDGADVTATRQAVLVLRRKLADKARRCRRQDLEAFWQQEPAAGQSWTEKARKALDTVLALREPIPSREDPLVQWLPDRVARRLIAAGLVTLGDLVVRRAGQGALWWRTIPRLGAQSVTMVERFLRAQAHVLGIDDLGVALRPSPVAETTQRAPGPPAWFDADPALSGAHGRNRAPAERCRIDAPHDYAAIQAWLGLWPSGSHTHRAYRKEAERFLLWAIQARNKPLSSLTTEDCAAYRAFLRNPNGCWTGALQRRWSPDWKPFQGPLSPRSIRHAEVILSALCAWLVKQRYLDSNPFDGLSRQRFHPEKKIQVERAFTAAEWQWLLAYCQRRAEESPRRAADFRRLTFILALAHCTGLRLSELAKATFGDLEKRLSPRGEQWWLQVVGKGQRQRKVPLPSGFLTALRTYAASRGIVWASADPVTPLIGKRRRTAPAGELSEGEPAFTPDGLHRVLRSFFREAGDALRETDPAAAERLSQASTHWLRHTHATHALAKQVPLTVVRDNLGHQSLSTTSVYLHAHEDERHAEIEKLYPSAGER